MEAHRLTHPLKFKVAFLSKKVMASVFWDRESGLMIEYLERAPLLMESIMLMNYTAYVKKSRKRRGKLRNGVHLLQDNAPAHTSKVAMAAEKECGSNVPTTDTHVLATGPLVDVCLHPQIPLFWPRNCLRHMPGTLIFATKEAISLSREPETSSIR